MQPPRRLRHFDLLLLWPLQPRRVRRRVNFIHLPNRHLCLHLRARELRVAQHYLHEPHVRSILQHQRHHRVMEQVARTALVPRTLGVVRYHPSQVTRVDTVSRFCRNSTPSSAACDSCGRANVWMAGQAAYDLWQARQKGAPHVQHAPIAEAPLPR